MVQQHKGRNNKFFDIWSLVHLGVGVVFGWLVEPFAALAIMVIWEPVEILLLSPFLAKNFTIKFGQESLKNSLSDVVFDALGVAIGAYLLASILKAPLHIF